jgi:diguanylate cyclase (GGDEF)-like protein
VEEDIVHGDPKKICEITVDLLSAGLSSDLSTGFDVALESYRTETVQKIKKHHLIQVYGTIIILLVLLLEAILIFRPLIARIKIYHRLLLKQALEDPLTKLKNRRAFTKSAESELRQSQRNKTPVSIALMDLDKFKLVNDTYGHDVGDTVLKHFSGMLKEHLRGGDIIGRVGGEEFAVVLVRSTDGPEAFKVLDRMRELVANTPCPYTDKSGKLCYLNYSVSIGVVALVPDDQKIEELLIISDEMLYKAKDTGRNKVVLAD